MRIVGGDGSGSTINCRARRVTTFQDVAEELTISSFYFDGTNSWHSGSEYIRMGRPLQPPRGKTDPFMVDFFKDQCADGGAYLKHSVDCGACGYFLNQNGCPCRASSSVSSQDTDFNYNFCKGGPAVAPARSKPTSLESPLEPSQLRAVLLLASSAPVGSICLTLTATATTITTTHTHTHTTSATFASLAPPQSSLGRSSPSR